MRMKITYANVAATMALFIALGGTATAAVVLTTTNIKDSTVTSADFKNGTLGVADLSARARAAFVGEKGATGRPGSTGPAGETGETGGPGPRGSAAFMTSAFAYRDTGLVTQRTGAFPPNNNGGTGKHWDDPTYASSAIGGPFPQIRTTGYQAINLDGTFQTVMALSGMTGSDPTRSPDTMLNVTFTEAILNATASASLLHRRDGDDLGTSAPEGTLLHGRVECALFFGSSSDPSQLTTMLGVKALASSGYDAIDHELVNVSLNGNHAYLASGSQYNVALKCRDADYTGQTQWQFARGNLTALASR